MTRTVAVLMGGWSAEREVSLTSGRAVADALDATGHRVVRIDVARDLDRLIQALTPRPDCVFNALHGRGGEDGTIQGVLELLRVPYTHSGVRASAVAMDKTITKTLVAAAGVPVAEGVIVDRAVLEGADTHPMAPPYVVKPLDEGSTVGVRLIPVGHNGPILEPGWGHGDRVLVERFVPGRELTVAVLGDRALGVTEIVFSTGIFDYTAKYTAGHARHILPAALPAGVATAACAHALTAHRVLGCRGATRTDFRYDDSRPGMDGLVFLETNTQPGMTPLSLVPEQAAHAGIDYPELVAWMVEEALCRG